LNPILALALKSHPHRKTQRSQLLSEIIAIFAVNPPQVGFAGDIRDLDTILLVKPMPGRKGYAEPLAVERQ